MNRFALFGMQFAFAAAFAASVAAQAVAPPAADSKTGSAEARFGLHFDPVAFVPPTVDQSKLENGIPLYHYAEPEVPLVSVVVRIGAGSVDDPAGKSGAAGMTAEVLRNGGSESLSGDKLDAALDARGAQLNAGAEREESWIGLSVLPEDLDWGMGVMSDLLAHPAFPADKLDEARGRANVDLKQRLDTPLSATRALFPQLLYGKGNPWGGTQTEKSLAALKIDDLKAMHAKYYRSDRMSIGITGAVAFDKAKELAAKYFGPDRFQKVEKSAAELPKVEPVDSMKIYVVPTDATQNVIYFGHEGITRFAPDKFPVLLFNEVLSGGFNSRLMRRVRSDRGLAYLVYGMIREGTVRGIFYNVALTKAETSSETLSVMLGVDRDMQKNAPTSEELELARQSTVNSFVFLFSTADQVVRQKMSLDAFGYPENYLSTYVENLKAVTSQQILEAAQKEIHLDKLVILVYGAIDDKLKAELAKLGPVTVIDDKTLRADWL